jgi:hypothetical protein
MKRPVGLAAALMATLTLGGCAPPPPPLYGWGHYQAQVYEYFKAQNSAPEAQVAVLEADLQKIRAKGQTPPPGYHAHLGMLYAALGKNDQAVLELQTEKSLFPESTIYIDRLLATYKK